MNSILKTSLLALALATTPITAAMSADAVKVALPSKMFLNVVEFVAQERGFYEAEDLEVEFTHIADSSIPVRTLIAGDMDIIQAGMAETLVAIGRGAELKTVGGVHNGLHYAFWTRPGSGIETIADLPGKNVAISSPGSLPHVVTLALLQKEGVPQSEIDKINWVAIQGSSARINGVITGAVDATVASYSPEVERSGDANLLKIVGPELPDYVMIPFDTTDRMIEERRDVLRRFIKAQLLATRFVLENKDETLAVAKGHFDYTDEDLNAFYRFYVDGRIWNPNGNITANAATYMQKLNVDTGLQDEVLPVEDVLDTSIVDEVIAEIGAYEK